MITEQELNAAIAECEGIREPISTDCIKLAAFYIIKNQLYSKSEQSNIAEKANVGETFPTYSTLPSVEPVKSSIYISSDTEFAQVVNGRNIDDIMPIIDELMLTLQALEPRLYMSVMRKIEE